MDAPEFDTSGRLETVILGSGSSGGVPRADGNWGECDPANPKNRRRRCSLLWRDREEGTTVLIDTSPDFRDQMLDAKVQRIDGVFFTHAHADQAHGIDDLRVFYLNQGEKIAVHGDAETMDVLTNRFSYCFASHQGYPAILEGKTISGPTAVAALRITPFTVRHGLIDALGFRCGNVAYIPDVSEIPDDAKRHLAGLDTLVIDALRYRPHPSHAHLDRTIAWIDELNPARAVLTNMHVDLDYDVLTARLPNHIIPAYDNMSWFSPLSPIDGGIGGG